VLLLVVDDGARAGRIIDDVKAAGDLDSSARGGHQAVKTGFGSSYSKVAHHVTNPAMQPTAV
jgi:hypothetical protein